MIGFTNAGGGSFSKLGIRVFTSVPASPKNGDIWVHSALPINNGEITPWSIGTDRSDSAENGYVFIHVDIVPGTFGIAYWATLNEKNPRLGLSCYWGPVLQKKNGKYQYMTAQIYIDGVWRQISSAWDGTLFYSGDQYTSVTGGWLGAQTTTPYLEEVTGCKPWNNDYNEGVICTANAIDLTNWKTLHIIGGGGGKDSESKYPMKAYVRKTYTGEDVATADFGDTALDSNTQRDIDISGLSGSYYILTGAAGNIRHSHRVVKAWLTA